MFVAPRTDRGAETIRRESAGDYGDGQDSDGRARGDVLFADPRTPGAVVDISRRNPDSAQMRDTRGARISIIFREPLTALSPVQSIGNQIDESLQLHRSLEQGQHPDATVDLLRLVT